MKKVIIIDDEQDARDLLKYYLSAHQEFAIIGEASHGYDAVELINQRKPDLLFLDIQMPGLNGFEVLMRLEELPEVIFSTAYDQYAIKAFEVHAIDYLLKPYGKKRFENALKRVDKSQKTPITLAEELLQKETGFPAKVILHQGSRKLMVNTATLIYAEAFGDYTKVFTEKSAFLSTKGISELQEILNPKQFIRIHRSYFANIDAISELKKIGRYYHLVLSNGKALKVSDSYLPAIKKIVL